MSEDKTTPDNPNTAVIFQAPEPAKPRRASAPAGPPKAPAGDGGDDQTSSKAPARKSPAKKKSAKGDGGEGSGTSGSDNAGSDNAVSGNNESAQDDSAAGSKRSKGSKGGGKSSKKDGSDAESSGKGDGDSQGSNNQGSNNQGDGGDPGNDGDDGQPRRRRRGGRGRGKKSGDGDGGSNDSGDNALSGKGDSGKGDGGGDNSGYDSGNDSGGNSGNNSGGDSDESGSSRRRRRRRGSRSGGGSGGNGGGGGGDDQLQGSTRLQAKRQRRRDSRDGSRRQHVISEAEFLARRESVKRSMVVRERDHRVQIAVLEDDVLVEHYVSHQANQSMAGNVYLARVQNVLPGMEAAFVDVGRGRNAVLYAGEVNWDAAGMEGKPRRIELAMKPGDTVMVQVTKDPIGHKGARVTSQISLAGRFLVYVPAGGVTGISRKLPDTERARLKKLLREVIPDGAGVIVRTAAEGASEDELRADVDRLKRQWEGIEKEAARGKAPTLLRGEPDMAIRVVRDIFNEDFDSATIQGDDTWNSLSAYVGSVAPDLMERLHKFTGSTDVFVESRVDEQLAKGMDRKVWLPSGGSLVIDRTEAMTVIDVNTGKFVGKGGTLEETMTLNNLEAAEEIVRQLRLRDIGGIIVIDFVDMLLEANRDRVLRRLIECLGRDRTKHQVAEVTSLGLVQMTRKRVGQGLVEAFSETCEHCKGRGFLVHGEPVAEVSEKQPERGGRRGGRGGSGGSGGSGGDGGGNGGGRKSTGKKEAPASDTHALDDRSDAREQVKATLASIAAAAEKAHHHDDSASSAASDSGESAESPEPVEAADHASFGDAPAAEVSSEAPETTDSGDAADAADSASSASDTEDPAKQ